MPPLMYPQLATKDTLQKELNQSFTLRLYSNNRTPQPGDTASQFVEVVNGGYAAIPLLFANFTITAGSPSIALYSDFQAFIFTAATDSPGKVYGYYITRNGDNLLLLAERFFPEALGDLFFTPANNKRILIRPRIAADNLVPLAVDELLE